jgi:ABC-2 type transport system ATP-binding protein
MKALEVKGVGHRYGRKAALEGIDLAVAPGEFCVLLGLNGAGKTTLFSLVAGLLDLKTGTVRVFGHGLPRKRRHALARSGFVFQQPALDLDLTVSQTLRYHAALHGLSRRESEIRIVEELARFDLADRAGDLVRRLSGGQRRRVEIARSLLHRPSLLLLDEPTVGLDVPSRRAILHRVRALCREEQAAVLWATHLLDEVFERDRTVVIHGGRIVDDGPNDPSVEPLPHRFARLVGLEAAA